MQDIPREVREHLADAAFEAIALLEGASIVWVNSAFEALFGVTRDAVRGQSPLDFAVEADRARILENIRTEVQEPYEVTGLRADGTQFVAQVRGRRIEAAGRTFRVSTVRDRTAPRAIEAELRSSRARYRLLFDSAADGMMVMDQRGMPREVNDRLCRMLGRTREEVLSLTPDQAIADLDKDPMRLERLAEVPSYVVERQLWHRDGSRVDVEVNLTAIGPSEVLAVIRDIRDRKRAATQEAQLRNRLQQAQSLSALGRLAGGVAHDFNNLLTIIIGSAETLKLAGNDNADLNEIVDAAHRAAEITAQLLTFSGQRRQQQGRADVAAQLVAFEPLLQRLLGDPHTLRLSVTGVPVVDADPGELNQVVMNLVLNARDAMPDGGPIDVIVEERQPEHMLRLQVRDRGTGIPDDVRERVFEPFFTTKGVGQGTGLGLSTVYGIVSGHGGKVEVESGPDGTLFTVMWPLARPEAVTIKEPIPRARTGARILLVEDDPAVRRAVRHMLDTAGHHVLEAGGTNEAVAIVADGAQYDLLLSDVVMPDGSGPDLAKRLSPPRVLFMSGFSGAALGAADFARVLAKPFSARELREAVASALAATGPEED